MPDTLPASADESTARHHDTATYSPDDNKLRLYALSRLPADLYARVKAAGFRWAPKQDLFFATWTPHAEDMAIELAGEIGDEDTSLVERAETRAERFEGYSDRRMGEAERAREAVATIADNIPLGQPILVGHHSEKRARRDAEKIQSGMRKAVRLWETSQYWTRRAAGAIRHAKYMERPQVRARRIKTIEADKRKAERSKAKASDSLRLWGKEGLTLEQACLLAGHGFNLPVCPQEEGPYWWDALDVLKGDGERYANCPAWTVERVQEKAAECFTRSISMSDRWIAHYDNRLAYERAMLEEQGASSLLEKAPRPKQPPLCNYRAPAGLDIPNLYNRGELIHYPQVEMTQAEYAKIANDYKGTRVVDNSHRVRTAYHGNGSKRGLVCVFLTDSKVHERPAAKAAPTPEAPRLAPMQRKPEPVDERAHAFDALRDSLRSGVTVVNAPQLFPTPAALAERLVDEAGLSDGMSVLEPSAGTGAILKAIRNASAPVSVTAVEVRRDFTHLNGMADRVHFADFTACGKELGRFDRILMNPPFENGADVEHVTHALGFLKDGGRLVAIMSAGVTFRQDRRTSDFRRMVDERGGTIEELPADAFKESGTQVRTVLVTIDG